jgi:ferredoxin
MSESENKGALWVQVDRERCQGHNRCVDLAPTLFDTDELGLAFVRGEGVVSRDDESIARLAVNSCPELAITLTELAQ